MSKSENISVLGKRSREEDEDKISSHPIYKVFSIKKDIKHAKGLPPYSVKRVPEDLYPVLDQTVDEVLQKSVLLYDEVMKSKSSLLLYKEIIRKHKDGTLFAEVEKSTEEKPNQLTLLHVDLFKYSQELYKNSCRQRYGFEFMAAISSIAFNAICFIRDEADKALNTSGILKRLKNDNEKKVSWNNEVSYDDGSRQELIDKYTKSKSQPKKEPGPSI